MTRILVVDDEPDLETLISQRFRKKIKSNEYQFRFAINGAKALEVLKEDPDIDLVLTDINMPEMDGLTLLKEINERDHFLKTIIVSAYGDMENIRTAMNLGAFDFITKPIDFQDMEITMSKTIQHIFDLQKSEQALRENDTLKIYLKEINAQKKLKDRFFTIISHDLRGPVNSFQGLVNVISMYIRKERYQDLEDMLHEVENSTGQLSRLLDNLLNWASQELSEIPYNPKKLDLQSIIDDQFQIFKSMAEAKHISLVNEVPDKTEIWADENSAITILRNLINNALKFTPEGGEIKVTVEDNDQGVLVKIIDTGVGIESNKIAKLFELSDDKSTYGTSGEKGVGLGLRLVNEFARLNKCNLKVESEVGKGTEFQLSFPTGK